MGSSNPLCLFNALSPTTHGNKVVVARCAKLATPHINMFCSFPFKTFNVESKCISWKFHGCGSKVRKDLVNDINYILFYYGFKTILELQAKFLAKMFVNGIIIFGVIVSNPIVRTILFGNCTTRCDLVQGTNLSNN